MFARLSRFYEKFISRFETVPHPEILKQKKHWDECVEQVYANEYISHKHADVVKKYAAVAQRVADHIKLWPIPPAISTKVANSVRKKANEGKEESERLARVASYHSERADTCRETMRELGRFKHYISQQNEPSSSDIKKCADDFKSKLIAITQKNTQRYDAPVFSRPGGSPAFFSALYNAELFMVDNPKIKDPTFRF